MWHHRSMQYERKLRVITETAEPQPAEISGKTTCQRSGVCCWRRPCELHGMADVERLATHLGLTPRELFVEYLVVDTLKHGLALVPRRVQQEGGHALDTSETYDMDTPCVFLDPANNNACKVHDVKPTGGAQWHCGMTDIQKAWLKRPTWSYDALRALGWDGQIDP